MNTSSPIIVALDFAKPDLALAFADQIDPSSCRLKVGKELFTQAGPSIVNALHARKFDVFLDLKFHDIPNTTAAAVAMAADMGVWMVNVHASGGSRMMRAAKQRLNDNNYKTKLIAVTVLTSMERADLTEIGLDIEPLQQVQRLAELTHACELDGVVCSAQEAHLLRQQRGKDFLLVCPGIRPADTDAQDQRRIMTPQDAQLAGVSYMVIGRPITQASNPLTALQNINTSLGIIM